MKRFITCFVILIIFVVCSTSSFANWYQTLPHEGNYRYQAPRIAAFGDYHADYDAMMSSFEGMKVVDSRGNWIFGRGHVVLEGDFLTVIITLV